jgi:hypothetical protein
MLPSLNDDFPILKDILYNISDRLTFKCSKFEEKMSRHIFIINKWPVNKVGKIAQKSSRKHMHSKLEYTLLSSAPLHKTLTMKLQ